MPDNSGWIAGIATLTSKYVNEVKHTKARIAATRKTTPGLRALEKRAVLSGGGATHRQSLSDAIMIKDNHIAMGGGIEKVLSRVMENADHMVRVSVEVLLELSVAINVILLLPSLNNGRV